LILIAILGSVVLAAKPEPSQEKEN